MLFDIFNYSIPLALSAYALFFVIIYFIFRKFITSYADPLVFHILWLSSQATFFVIYAEKNTTGLFYWIFAFSLVVYTASLIIFFRVYECKKRLKIESASESETLRFKIGPGKWLLLVGLLFTMFLYSYKSFFYYALTSQSLPELFLYRFVNLQGRDAVERIFGATSYLLYLFLFYGIQKNVYKALSIILIVLVLILGVLSGGRSTLIGIIASLGAYIFYFAHRFQRKTIVKLNRMVLALILLAMVMAVFVSSFYEDDGTFLNGLVIIFNRIFAAPDGIEYYLKYSGEDHIETGLVPYFLSVFGIYVKNLFGIEVKNIGWQLTELAVGNVDFAQGSNYTVLLQAVVFNHYLAPVYALLVAWVVAKLRYMYTSKLPALAIYFTFSNLALIVATDLEYFSFLALSVMIIYFLLAYPVMKLKI